MLVICNPYVSVVRFKDVNKYHKFNFHFNPKFNGIKNDNRHKKLCYFNENYKRFDKKSNKISYHAWKNSFSKKYSKKNR